MEEDKRYPYTYACDLIRQIAGYHDAGTKLSRSDANAIIFTIARALGVTKEELMIKLADYYKDDHNV